MTRFFDKSQTVNVSRISADGWWIENTIEHVAKGTALGKDFTTNIYTPSNDDKIAHYDRKTELWSEEIINMTWLPYWNINGQKFVIGTPNGHYPEWAIKDEPPLFNPEKETVLYLHGIGWKTYEILIGTPFYDKWGSEFLVSDYNFELPQEHTWEKPPLVKKGNAIKLENEQWIETKDNRGLTAYAKSGDWSKNYEIKSLEPLPDSHTLKEPFPYSIWQDNDWIQQIDLLQVAKRNEINQWRDTQEASPNDIVTVNGIEWDANPSARSRIESTLNSDYLPPFWTDANDVDQPITLDVLKAVHTAIVQRGFEIHARQRQMKAEIDQITDFATLEAYPIGWSE